VSIRHRGAGFFHPFLPPKAAGVWAAAPHGLFTGNAAKVLSEPALDKILVTYTVPARTSSPSRLPAKAVVLDISSLISGAVHRLHANESIMELMALA